MVNRHIALQSSIGDFDATFRAELPALEQAMIAHNISPGDFIISKDAAPGPMLPIVYRPGGNPVEYTVFVKGRSFTVRERDDASFLAYLYGLCTAEPKADAPHSMPGALQTLIHRLVHWGNKPI